MKRRIFDQSGFISIVVVAVVLAAVVGGALVFVMNAQSAKQSDDTIRAAESTAVELTTKSLEPSGTHPRRGEFRPDEPYLDPAAFDPAITGRIENYQDMPTDLQIAAYNMFAVSKKNCDKYGAGDTRVVFEALSANKDAARFTDTCTGTTGALYFVKDSNEWFSAYSFPINQLDAPSICKGSEDATTFPPTGVSLNGDIVGLPTITSHLALKEILKPICTY